ncbi:unnamed protein product [Cuscuta epithymum]|uniref:Retrovirus-related Pol polyprotein from transposon TNT 1-94-like beta-barrel domain-containing protein n=1 Tax=Cuscuta epithymum TaxID=186058 RepID=A0AAV0E3S3_9ASTE|nr:unnamed protein product [Cuscuta epithymum]
MGDETAPRLDPVSRGPAAGGSLPAAVTRGEGGAVRAHAVTSLDLPHTTTPESSRSGGGNYNQLKELTGEQVQAFLHTINAETHSTFHMSGKHCTLDWTIDTGASRHVTGDLSRLTDVVSIRDCSVGLPDGRTVYATLEGRVVLSNDLALDHVLYVPKLNCHLISISQLTDQSACLVTFTNSLCAIQDLHSRSLIGAGERRDGLFYFRRVPALHAVRVTGIPEFELWHRRLGHPSDRVLKLLPAISSSSFK